MFERPLIVLALSAIASSGCGFFAKACETALPVIQQAKIYGDDAEASLNRVQLMFGMLDVSDSEWQRISSTLQIAWNGLRAAQATLLVASDKCSGVDPFLVFAEFIDAWRVVEKLLAKHSSLLGAGAQPSDYAPLIVRAVPR